jgi:glycosyltransferase involved in cell wall biosynthesis
MPLGIQNITRKIIKNKKHNKVIPLDEHSLNKKNIAFIQQILKFITKDKSIFYVQPTVMNFTGTDCYNGGAERYVLDLSKLCIDLGYHFYCIQFSSANPWIRHYYGLTIIGLPSFYDLTQFQKYVELLTNDAALIISSPFSLVKKNGAKNIIGISHGIYWDTNNHNHTAEFLAREIKYLDRLVSVDTATINFMRSHRVSEIHKISFIPNYVSHKNFHCEPKKKEHDELIILYPRRLYAPRGFWLVHNIIPKILAEFNHVSFLFCGKGDEAEIKAVNKLIIQYGSNKIRHMTAPPHEMADVYKKSDIVLVPTINSEGTSFSVIEAMACKKPVISTYVGGLVDLITDHFTGLMIAPDNESELYNAIKKLITDKELREYIIDNAYKKSLTFSLKNWQQKWQNIINSLLNNLSKLSENKYTNNNLVSDFSLLHLHAEGIRFDEMVQRPQQLFISLSEMGINCMFIEDKSEDNQQCINKNLILAGKRTELDFSGYIAYSYLAYHYELIKKNKPHRLIYDVLDNPDIHISEPYLKYHQLMLNTADIILTSSQLLFSEFIRLLPNKIIKYVPNAANPDSTKKNEIIIKPDDFPNYSKQTIGFYGALAEWFDFELLGKVCERFMNCQIMLLGPCKANSPESEALAQLLKNNPNLFYLGVKKFTELQNYAHFFNVSIIPFLYNSITENCSPVKLFEYMNYSAPIVTTDMPECRQYHSALRAKNDDEFLSLIDYAFKLPKNHEYFHIMKKEAQENTWEHRAKIIIAAIYESLNTL